MSKRAIITGITGQDGSYLAELLLEKGYHVVGVTRRLSSSNYWRIEHLLDRIELRPADLLDQLSLIRVIADVRPDEFYNLAAMSFVPASWDQPFLTGEFNAQGVTRVLEAIRHVDPSIRLYQASSSEMYGKVREVPQTETDAVLSAQPVRRVEGVRPLHHGQLPRELRPLRRVRAFCSTTSRRAAASSSSPARSPTASRGSSWGSPTRWPSAISTRSATGVLPATTSARCG